MKTKMHTHAVLPLILLGLVVSAAPATIIAAEQLLSPQEATLF